MKTQMKKQVNKKAKNKNTLIIFQSLSWKNKRCFPSWHFTKSTFFKYIYIDLYIYFDFFRRQQWSSLVPSLRVIFQQKWNQLWPIDLLWFIYLCQANWKGELLWRLSRPKRRKHQNSKEAARMPKKENYAAWALNR